MLGGSVPLKVETPYGQWFYGALKPYRNYVPVKGDLSDVVEQVEWLRQNDHIAREIVQNNLAFASKYFSNEAIEQLMLQTFIEYEKMYS